MTLSINSRKIVQKASGVTAVFFILAASLLSFLPAQVHAAELPSTPNVNYPMTNGSVVAIIAAADGSQYIGGNFSEVDGVPRNNIARILADGTVDPTFDPDINSGVLSLALNASTNTIYVGGWFGAVNGSVIRNRLAAFDATTGVVTGFDPDVESGVFALAIDEATNTVYAGGWFEFINGGTPVSRFAALNGTTGVLDDPIILFTGDVYALELDTDSNILYVGGWFGSVDGLSLRSSLAAIDTTTGTVTDFDPSIDNGFVRELTLDRATNTLYVGGNFTHVNAGVPRDRIAAFDTTTGLVTDFNPGVDSDVYAIFKHPVSGDIFVSGTFTLAGEYVGRNYLAVFDSATSALRDFNPNFETSEEGGVFTLAYNSSTGALYAGGTFAAVGDEPRVGLAMFGEFAPPSPVPDNGGDGSSTQVEHLAETGQPAVLYTLLGLSLIAASLFFVRKHTTNM